LPHQGENALGDRGQLLSLLLVDRVGTDRRQGVWVCEGLDDLTIEEVEKAVRVWVAVDERLRIARRDEEHLAGVLVPNLPDAGALPDGLRVFVVLAVQDLGDV